ncbi:thiopeptide-type bacteriocin biosynthesis protein [Streptomyces lavendulae]|uniref:thiopeptide-type bacteriocin biosynthesis protein n=1 Tax=Streptomyces lavendulae TaxID=1914 RepID=UPI00367E3965
MRESLPALITALREAGLLRRWFFIRYWQGGPHLRLRQAFADLPRDGHAPQDYLRAVGDLAAASTASDPTVHPALYEPETAPYGTGPALEAAE